MRFTLIGALLALAAPLGAGNLVTNGDFTSDCSGWATANTDGSFCQVAPGQTLGAGNPGGWVALNNAPEPIPSMSQTIIGLTVGTQYVLTWDMQSAYHCCGDPSTDGVSVDIDGNNYLFTVLNTDTWQTFSRTFSYTGTSDVLTFTAQLNATDQDAGFDNISLSPISDVPEPASFVLVGLGLALVGSRPITRYARARR